MLNKVFSSNYCMEARHKEICQHIRYKHRYMDKQGSHRLNKAYSCKEAQHKAIRYQPYHKCRYKDKQELHMSNKAFSNTSCKET